MADVFEHTTGLYSICLLSVQCTLCSFSRRSRLIRRSMLVYTLETTCSLAEYFAEYMHTFSCLFFLHMPIIYIKFG